MYRMELLIGEMVKGLRSYRRLFECMSWIHKLLCRYVKGTRTAASTAAWQVSPVFRRALSSKTLIANL